MARRPKGEALGWFVYPRGGQWIVRHRVDIVTNKWSEHRIPRANARTKSQAETYARLFLDDLHAEVERLERQTGETNPLINSVADRWLVLRREKARADELAPSTVEGCRRALRSAGF